MDSAIEQCIDVAESLAKSPYDSELASRIIPGAREELADLRTEVAAAHKYQVTVYRRLLPVEKLWQKETGHTSWPDLVVLVGWLRVRGDKALAELREKGDGELDDVTHAPVGGVGSGESHS